MIDEKTIQIIDIPKISEPQGSLSVIEKDVIPFEMKRVYYLSMTYQVELKEEVMCIKIYSSL